MRRPVRYDKTDYVCVVELGGYELQKHPSQLWAGYTWSHPSPITPSPFATSYRSRQIQQQAPSRPCLKGVCECVMQRLDLRESVRWLLSSFGKGGERGRTFPPIKDTEQKLSPTYESVVFSGEKQKAFRKRHGPLLSLLRNNRGQWMNNSLFRRLRASRANKDGGVTVIAL